MFFPLYLEYFKFYFLLTAKEEQNTRGETFLNHQVLVDVVYKSDNVDNGQSA
jgi:hypothetical protein